MLDLAGGVGFFNIRPGELPLYTEYWTGFLGLQDPNDPISSRANPTDQAGELGKTRYSPGG